jgi:flagellar FliL protein
MSKPPAKSAAKSAAAPAEAEAEAAPAKSGNKKKMIIISVLALAIAGGAGWYFTKGHAPEEGHAEKVKEEPLHEPIFVSLGENFTVNLQREEGDQYLQAGITLKILQPDLEEKIKKAMPEIKSKLLFLLSSKFPSELQTAEGKKKLVAEIIAEVDGALGLGAEPAHASAPAAAPAQGAEHGEAAAASAPAAPQAAPVAVRKTKGVVDVLFTSFIIQ